MPLGSEVVPCTTSTAHYPKAVRQCIATVALPTTPRQCGTKLWDFHCPLPPGIVVVHCRRSR